MSRFRHAALLLYVMAVLLLLLSVYTRAWRQRRYVGKGPQGGELMQSEQFGLRGVTLFGVYRVATGSGAPIEEVRRVWRPWRQILALAREGRGATVRESPHSASRKELVQATAEAQRCSRVFSLLVLFSVILALVGVLFLYQVVGRGGRLFLGLVFLQGVGVILTASLMVARLGSFAQHFYAFTTSNGESLTTRVGPSFLAAIAGGVVLLAAAAVGRYAERGAPHSRERTTGE